MALVTGAARGLGLAVASLLAEQGLRVVLLDRSESVFSSAEKLAADGRQARPVQADVTDRPRLEEALAAVRREWGPVLVLVNCAAIVDHVAPFHQMTAEGWERDIAVNLTGVFHCTQAVISDMLGARWGRVICVSSIVAETGLYAQAGYTASKAGILGLVRTLALEYGRHGICVNAVLPGLMDTEPARAIPASVAERMRRHITLRQPADPRQVAHVIAFLASDVAGYVNGAAIPVSAGMELLNL